MLPNDPFAASLPTLADEELGGLTALAQRLRPLATEAIEQAFAIGVQIADARLRELEVADLDLAFQGTFLIAEAELTTADGFSYPALTLVSRDDFLRFPGTAEDPTMSLSTVNEVFSALVDPLNGALGKRRQIAFLGMREAEVGGASVLTETVGDANLYELSYRIADENGELFVTTIAPIDFFRNLVDPAPAARGAASGAAGRRGSARSSANPPLRRGPGSKPESGAAVGRGMEQSMDIGSPLDFGSLKDDDGPSVRPAQFAPLSGLGDTSSQTNIEMLLDVTLRITVELGRSSMSLREVLELGPGSVVELDKLAGEPVDILVNDLPVAKGEVVVVDENFGVRVTDIIAPAKRVASLR